MFILILIPTIITALEKLDLKGISDPAISMLHHVTLPHSKHRRRGHLNLSGRMAWKMGRKNGDANAVAFTI